MMKFSHRVAALVITVFTAVTVYLMYDANVFVYHGSIPRSKLIDSHVWPVKIDHNKIVPDITECRFSETPNSVEGLHTDELLSQALQTTFRNRLVQDPRHKIKSDRLNAMGKPLKVFLVPHSHNDPGWLKTLNDYYEEQTKLILDNMVNKLSLYKNMTFIWAETVFLSMWWNDIDKATKTLVKKFLKEGRLEIVNGGWVAPDEATTHYMSVIDQMIEGHQWLEHNLNYKPKVNWSPDPFGYSATFPYLMNRAGIDKMVGLRVHSGVKELLRENKALEFLWRQAWDHNDGETETFFHLMPYSLYSIKYSCGPHPYICLMFDFRRIIGENSESISVAITPQNVDKYSRNLANQLRLKSKEYRHDVVFFPLGDDFRYDQSIEWDQQYTNFQKLFDHINKQNWNIDIQFGTLSDYFAEIKKSGKQNKVESGGFPVLYGDFFPYTDKDFDYWTGYYTTRPFYKQLARELMSDLRSAEILNSLGVGYSSFFKQPFNSIMHNRKRLIEARRLLALFQHHDAITGTSKPETLSDYEKKLWQVKFLTNEVKITSSRYLLSQGSSQEESARKPQNEIGMNFDVLEARSIDDPLPTKKVIPVTTEGTSVVFFNPLTKLRDELVRVWVTSSYVVVMDSAKNVVPSQLNPIWQNDGDVASLRYEVSFYVSLPPLGMVTYILATPVSKDSDKDVAIVASIFSDVQLNAPLKIFKVHPISKHNPITLENYYFAAEFSSNTGLLNSISLKHNGFASQIWIQFLAYQSRGSGAYLFFPQGAANNRLFTQLPAVHIVSGPLVSEVRVSYGKLLRHIVRVYHTKHIQGTSLEIENFIDMSIAPKTVNLNEKEPIMRIMSSMSNSDTFYTDSNGFQMMRRETYQNEFYPTVNYYPMTTMAYIQDNNTRLSLLSGQSHGASSMRRGWLEVMLDRRLAYDDQRGLGEGILDNRLTPSKFLLLLEVRDSPKGNMADKSSYPSLLAHSLSNQLNHPLVGFTGFGIHNHLQIMANEFAPMRAPLPCDIQLVNLRGLGESSTYSDTVSSFHRFGYECSFPTFSLNCLTSSGKIKLGEIFKNIGFIKVTEKTLSLMYEKKPHSPTGSITLNPMEVLTLVIKWKREHD